MSWVGGWLGGTVVTTYLTPPHVTEPVESPLEPTDPEYVDHVQEAINRLCQYAKAKAQ